jgi:aldose 1-epimerase
MTSTMQPPPPSGRQLTLRHGPQEAVVVTVGGGVRTYTVGGLDVLDGYAETAMCDGARGQQLVPWPNRVADGQWRRGGRDRQLALTEPAQHNAIHGLARWVGWDVTEHHDDLAVLQTTIHPQPGWDWTLDARVSYRLDATGLRVTTALTNRSGEPAPVAAGAHPYLTAGTPTVDTASLVIPAATRITTGPQQIPDGSEAVEGTAYDFRSARRIDDLAIDFAFADLIRDDDGRARVRLEASDGRWSALWVDEAYPWLEVFTGDALPDADRRRQGLGVEPMSAPPNALATGEGIVELQPGATWTGEWGIETSLSLA